MAATPDSAAVPTLFQRAAHDLLHASWRPELLVEEIPAPQKIAPFAAAVSADVVVGGEDVGTGRLVLLHDPAGNAAWQGTFRCVTFARAEVDPEMVSDPLLAQVGWSWLIDALAGHGADYLAPSGTVTSVSSESFGGMADEEPSAEVEVRASWTPVLSDGDGLAAHVQAWGELLCTTAGLPRSRPGLLPSPPGDTRTRALIEAHGDGDRPDDNRPVSTVASDPDGSDAPLLVSPADGTPDVEETRARLDATIDALAAGSGPIAVDAERAHGFRYTQRAYLIQVRRAGAGTHLIDPVAFDGTPGLAELGSAIADAEWVIHAASQDLPCLSEVGMTPGLLFDTELAARLLNYPRVALGTMLEELLGVRLLKEHSAADWSTRPLPDDWLTYAALDVELLIELRDVLAEQLVAAGKDEWAAEEFAALVAGAGTAAEPRPDPWRRTSGIHQVRTRRGLAYVAELWQVRDEIARDSDRAPSKILPDVAIAELAAAEHPDRATIYRIPGFQRRQARRYLPEWLAGLQRVAGLRDAQLPPMHIPSPGPPQPRLWASKDPAAARRLVRVREALTALAAQHELPSENLLTPEYVRRLAWAPPTPLSVESVDATLAELGARPWQRRLTVPALTAALAG